MTKPYAQSFSRAVLDGLRVRRPLVAADLFAGRTAMTAGRVSVVFGGHSDFTDDEVGLIEDLADLTGLQLAATMAEPDGGPITEMADGWARVREPEQATRATVPGDNATAVG